MLIGRLAPMCWSFKADTPYKTVKDIVVAAKAQRLASLRLPRKVTARPHTWPARCSNRLPRSRLTHVPYGGAGPAITDLLGGQVNMMIGTAAAVAPFVQGGKLRALGVTTASASRRHSRMSPTIAESGVAGVSRRELVWPVCAGRDARQT